jgi:histidinol-phosphatase (PHP family)
VLASLAPEEPLVMVMDDTLIRKRGRKVYGASWKRDPLGPPFCTNLVWGQRFLQLSAALPDRQCAGRACTVPVSFTHAPTAKKAGLETFWNLKEERINDYVNEVLSAKIRWQGKLNVFLGLEVDYIKGLRSPIDNDIKTLNTDYLIGSVHYIVPPNDCKPFTIDGSMEELENGLNKGFGGNWEMLMNCYYDAVAEMIALGGFEILGHADLIKKNCEGKNYWSLENELCRQKEIARAAANAGITVEVNTGGMNRGKTSDVYPSLTFLKFFREYNVPVIITADAHRAEHINGNYDTAVQTLVCADFNEHMIFLGNDKGKPL